MNLSTLRSYRTHMEESLRIELAELQKVVQHEQDIQSRLLADAEQGAGEFLQMARTGMSVDEARAHQGKLDALARAIKRASDEVTKAQRHCDHKMAELLEASRERKKIELLEERQTAQVAAEDKRREQAMLDHTATVRYLAEQQQRVERGDGSQWGTRSS